MKFFLGLLGIIISFAMLKYRQSLGDTIGEAYWMRHVGGVYNVVILVAFFLFFWSIAELTGTTSVFFWPLKMLIPSGGRTPVSAF